MTQPALELAEVGQLDSYRAGDKALLLAAAEAAVRSYCGWHIAPSRTEPVTVNGSGRLTLPLPTMHMTGLDALTEDGADVDTTTLEWSEAGYVWRAAPWTTRLRGVTATIRHGYASVPLEVQAVVLAVAARAVVSPDGIVREQVGQVSVTFSQAAFNVAANTALLEHERAALDRYRLPGTP